ncbi:MAG: radical SAM protein [Oscillospiraceae bacterium]|nr:radical SAM protein [Oscillospiraceae bacterium]
MFNKNVRMFSKNDYVCLYNIITMNTIYLKQSTLTNKEKTKELISKMPQDFLKGTNHYEQIQESIKPFLLPKLKTLFMIINETCNLFCKYCRYIQKLPKNHVGTVMDKTIGKGIIEKFLSGDNTGIERKSIVIFGTEILQHPDLVESLAKCVREFDAKNNVNTELTMFTNGVLINNKVIKIIKENSIVTIISIDGPKEIHDQARIYRSGKGSYEIVKKNCDLLRENGIRFGISTAVGEHNIDALPDIIEHFVKEFNPINIGLNPMEINKDAPKDIFYTKFMRQSLKAFEIARNYGVSLPQVMRRIRPFVERRQRIKECPTCGGSLRVYPNGRIGTCSHFVANDEYCIPYKTYVEDGISKNKIIRQWSLRTQFNFPKCSECEAISLCGGGCVYNAFLQNNDIMSPDHRVCSHSKYGLEWCIWKLFDDIVGKKILEISDIIVPDIEMRRALYGKIDEVNNVLPLQEYNSFGEVSLNIG